MKKGKASLGLNIRLIGAVIGSVGFVLTAYNYSVVGTALVGIGATLIVIGDKNG